MDFDESDWSFRAKWPDEVGELGFTAVPNALLRYYAQLDITPSEFLILVNIESYRWNATRLPFPSVATLAQRAKLSERTITRNITSLQNRGMIWRQRHRGYSNEYSLEPLGDILSILAGVTYITFSNAIRVEPNRQPHAF